MGLQGPNGRQQDPDNSGQAGVKMGKTVCFGEQSDRITRKGIEEVGHTLCNTLSKSSGTT